jgi:hypothetical protein
MQYHQHEAYTNGHYAGLDLTLPPLPLWAQLLECDYSGLWVYISIKDFSKSCKHIVVLKPTDAPVYLELASPEDDMMRYPSFLRDLEMHGLNLLAHSIKVELECFGATLQATPSGQNYLAGLFVVHNTVDNDNHVHTFSVRGRLNFPRSSTGVHAVLDSGLIPYFKIEVKATMNPLAAVGHDILHYDSGNPLFGFFGMEEEAKLAPALRQSSSATLLTKFVSKLTKS